MTNATINQLRNAAYFLKASIREFTDKPSGKTGAVSFYFNDGRSWHFDDFAENGVFCLQARPEIVFGVDGPEYTDRPAAEIWAIIEAILRANFDGLDGPNAEYWTAGNVWIFGNADAPVFIPEDCRPNKFRVGLGWPNFAEFTSFDEAEAFAVRTPWPIADKLILEVDANGNEVEKHILALEDYIDGGAEEDDAPAGSNFDEEIVDALRERNRK